MVENQLDNFENKKDPVKELLFRELRQESKKLWSNCGRGGSSHLDHQKIFFRLKIGG